MRYVILKTLRDVIVSRRVVVAFLILAFVAGAVLLWFCDPTKYAIFPKCPFNVLTGLKCPGCGTSRAIHSALNGRWGDAISVNPILVIVIPLIVAMLIFPNIARNRHVGYGVCATIILYWIGRNLL